MDRIYVKQQAKTPVHQLGLDLWRDHVVREPRIRERLRGQLLEAVQKERGGELIDRGLVRAMTTMLVDLGHAGERGRGGGPGRGGRRGGCLGGSRAACLGAGGRQRSCTDPIIQRLVMGACSEHHLYD